MEWEITIKTNDRYVEIVTSGVADYESSMQMAKVIAETMRHHRITHALIDHRNIKSTSGSVLEVIERPKLFRIIGMILGIKIAAIVHPGHAEHFKFLETVCVNQGFKYSVFYDKESALEWFKN